MRQDDPFAHNQPNGWPCGAQLRELSLKAKRLIDVGRKTRVYQFRAMPPKRRTVERRINPLIAGGVLALAAALAANPVSAAQDYPLGLFENSPVAPSGPPEATVPSAPPDDDVPFEPPREAVEPLDDYCDGLASRIFRSLAEVRQPHVEPLTAG
jgi:hypothetical protein